MSTVSETLREAIKTCEQTRYEISKATGVSNSVLSRFVASGEGLRSQNLDILAEHLDLVLVPKTAKTRKTK